MSKQSKFYQVTNQVLLEYITDQYRITTSHTRGEEAKTKFYMYIGNDGNQYCLDKSNISNTKYSDENNTEYYYGGASITELDLEGEETSAETAYGRDMYLNEDNKIGTLIKSKDNQELRSANLNHDTIRLYISTGYVMNNIAGYNITVKAHVNKVQHEEEGKETIYKRIDDYLYFLDWFMPKESLKDKIQWLKNPLYLNSKFYDRYIEIKFPSPLDAALNNRGIDYVYEYINEEGKSIFMRGNVDKNTTYIIDFSTVQPQSIDYVNESNNLYECRFVVDPAKQIGISQSSNANNFNVRLEEDEEAKSILYYPVYGDILNANDLDLNIMSQIEYGTISMYDEGDYDTINEGMDDFIEMYGDSVFRWVIINELTVSYVYEPQISTNEENSKAITFTEYYTNTIDYTDKKKEHGDFWRCRFTPYIKKRNNLDCKSIIISYTAHLFNRMNNIDIIRTGSMAINPKKYVPTSINTNNVIQYKIVNKIENNPLQIIKKDTGQKTGQIIRSYYDATNILIKDVTTGTMYSNGKMTLYLTHSNNNYMLKLYSTNDDGVRIPYDLTGNVDYKLVFPSANGSTIEIFPNKDSENYNLGIGSLIFYITSDKANAVMNVPMSERYFALTTHIPNNKQEESTLYEGYVEWYR